MKIEPLSFLLLYDYRFGFLLTCMASMACLYCDGKTMTRGMLNSPENFRGKDFDSTYLSGQKTP